MKKKMSRPRQFSGLISKLERMINIAFKKVDLNPKEPRSGLEKILETKNLSLEPQK